MWWYWRTCSAQKQSFKERTGISIICQPCRNPSKKQPWLTDNPISYHFSRLFSVFAFCIFFTVEISPQQQAANTMTTFYFSAARNAVCYKHCLIAKRGNIALSQSKNVQNLTLVIQKIELLLRKCSSEFNSCKSKFVTAKKKRLSRVSQSITASRNLLVQLQSWCAGSFLKSMPHINN